MNWRNFLARPQLPQPTTQALDALAQQTILITGAGGSIGSELALRLGALSLPNLVLLEASESNLYALERDWEASGAACPMTPILGGVGDESLLEEIFVAHAPRIVFHAAAFKQVPLMEQQPLAAIGNNIFGTETLTRTAAAHGARVVLLSTDKAVAPSSVMGATKRVAEQIVLACGGTALRLGNVLASRDSVAQVFAREIAQGGPATITDSAARRYFLTLDEAVNLLLNAASFPEPGTLLAPILSATHSIQDLARFMARVLRPEREIGIEIIGNRPGDKRTEALWSADERTHAISIEGMVAIETPLLPEALRENLLANLRIALAERDTASALNGLRALVPDFTPSRAVLSQVERCGSRVCL
jgi:FlaA1/EpsC-like NDP-sugar epimerase